MAFLSQASHLGSLLLPHDAFQEHAAHLAEWSAKLRSKGSERTCIRSGLATFLHYAFTAHSDLVVKRQAIEIKTIILSPICKRAVSQHHVKSGNRGVSCSHHWRLIGLPRNPGECGYFQTMKQQVLSCIASPRKAKQVATLAAACMRTLPFRDPPSAYLPLPLAGAHRRRGPHRTAYYRSSASGSCARRSTGRLGRTQSHSFYDRSTPATDRTS